MRRLQPVIWAKGTFLSPQHLQAQDIFHEDLMQFRVDALNYFPWGFRSLTLDRDALAAGNLAIDSASGIFPDGLVFDIPNSDLAPLPKPLAAYFDPTCTTIDVHLAVPAWRYGNVNVATTANSDADTRYLAEVSLLRDENASQIERPVQIARKNFRLLVDSEAREGTPAIKVARVTRTVRAAAAQHFSQRLSHVDRSAIVRKSHGEKCIACGHAPAEESGLGGIHGVGRG